MAGNQTSVSGLVLAGCLVCAGLLSVSGGARAADRTPDAVAGDEAGPSYSFDLPSQPLAAALSQYGAVTGLPVLYPSSLTEGRSSAAVRGRHTAQAALQLLLAGSGLGAERIRTDSGDTFMLRALAADSATAPALPALDGAARGYAGRIQARLMQLLCADPATTPGRYSALLQFQLDGAGQVRRLRLLDSSGDAARDRRIIAAVARERMEQAPPAALAGRALTMAILPAGAGGDTPCRDDEQDR